MAGGKSFKAKLSASVKDTQDELAKASARFNLADQVMMQNPHGLAATRQGLSRGSVQMSDADSNEEAKIHLISVDRLKDNPYNARQIYKPSIVKERAISLKANGQKVPVIVAYLEDDPETLWLVDGHYRKRGCIEAGIPEMKCVLQPVRSKRDLYKLSFLANEEREGGTPLDNALSWKRLLDDKQIEREEDLCELTGMSWGNVNKTLAILKLPTEVIDFIREAPERFGLGICYELTLFSKEMRAEIVLSFAQRIVDEEMSFRQVVDFRKKSIEGRERKAKEISRQYKLPGDMDGVNRGFIKEWDSGKVTFEVRDLTEKERADLVSDLRKRFGAGE